MTGYNDLLLQWAENEVKLAIEDLKKHGEHLCNRDLQIRQFREALCIYRKYCLDESREMSTAPVNYIVDHLINNLPLTDLTNGPCEWHQLPDLYITSDEKVEYYTHKRYPALCKKISPGGTEVYNDNRRIKFCSIRNPEQFLDDYDSHRFLNKLLPITMPYMPPLHPYEMIGETFLTDPKNGDYDTIGYFYIKCPNGDMISINRYFKLIRDTETEISNFEYNDRKQDEV